MLLCCVKKGSCTTWKAFQRSHQGDAVLSLSNKVRLLPLSWLKCCISNHCWPHVKCPEVSSKVAQPYKSEFNGIRAGSKNKQQKYWARKIPKVIEKQRTIQKTTRNKSGPGNRHRRTGAAWPKTDKPTRSEGTTQASIQTKLTRGWVQVFWRGWCETGVEEQSGRRSTRTQVSRKSKWQQDTRGYNFKKKWKIAKN